MSRITTTNNAYTVKKIRINFKEKRNEYSMFIKDYKMLIETPGGNT